MWVMQEIHGSPSGVLRRAFLCAFAFRLAGEMVEYVV